jgi:hypothetical protein
MEFFPQTFPCCFPLQDLVSAKCSPNESVRFSVMFICSA